MKANAELRLLSSLVQIDSVVGVTASFGVSFHEIKCNGMTSFMEFMFGSASDTTGLLASQNLQPSAPAAEYSCQSALPSLFLLFFGNVFVLPDFVTTWLLSEYDR